MSVFRPLTRSTWRLCSPGHCSVCGGSVPSRAVPDRFELQALKHSDSAMSALRRLLMADESGVASWSDDEVIEQISRRLERGLLQVCGERSAVERPAQGRAANEQPALGPSRARRAEQPEHWIEIRLVDVDNLPVVGEPYLLRAPDQTLHEGRLDHNGLARIDGLVAGTCQVSFPEIDAREWRAA